MVHGTFYQSIRCKSDLSTYLLFQLMANAYSTSLVFCLLANKSALELQVSSADRQDLLATCPWRSI